jgi:hypothetical protein
MTTTNPQTHRAVSILVRPVDAAFQRRTDPLHRKDSDQNKVANCNPDAAGFRRFLPWARGKVIPVTVLIPRI